MGFSLRRSEAVLACLVVLVSAARGVQKKNRDDVTQTLALPKEPPQVMVGETRRLVFSVSPPSAKGPLAQQARDALRAVLKLNGGLPVIHLRAFVAGSGDARRVPQVVSEVFGEKKMALPSVSLMRVGGLPGESVQVMFEAVSVSRREVNPGGLRFAVSEAATAPDPMSPVKPLLQQSLDGLAGKLNGETALLVSCFVSTPGSVADLSAIVAARFPGAAVSVVQPQRGPYQAQSVCEGVARGTAVTADKLAFTGTRVAFGMDEKSAALAFQRLERDLEGAGARAGGTVFTNVYPLSAAGGETARKLSAAGAPVAVVPVEGLASMDAGFAVDVVAVLP